MSGFLDSVLAGKRAAVGGKKRRLPAEALRREGPLSPLRDFEGAVRGGGVIAEIKKRSPTASSFRQRIPVADLASLYERAGACAISIVTDEENFGTCAGDISAVRGASRLPVLAKDFIVDAYQVRELWAAGADAVLLIARALERESLSSLLREARDAGMAALVECHSEGDIEKAAAAGATLIGINNRDLETLRVVPWTALRLLPHVPRDCCVVCESGVKSRAEVLRYLRAGIRAFLVGGALLDSEDPAAKLAELLGKPDVRSPRGA